jgi:hypothetical protein
MNRIPVQFLDLVRRFSRQRGALFTLILFGALLAFEVFNYSTTDFALNDLLGNLTFLGLRWSTILSLAFCGIDFAGIARLFTPEQGRDEPTEVWYLFGAWVLAAAMNATLTWWGVALALVSHTPASTAIIARSTLNSFVPVFVAVMVWLIRILIIGTFSLAGDRLFAADNQRSGYRPQPQPAARPFASNNPHPAALNARPVRPQVSNSAISRPEPTYHPVAGLAAKPRNDVETRR